MCHRCDQAREDCLGMIRETARAFMRAKVNGASARLVAQWSEALRELADSYRGMKREAIDLRKRPLEAAAWIVYGIKS